MTLTNLDGSVTVDSNSVSAIKISSNAQLKAQTVNVVGNPGISASGNGKVIGTVNRGVAPVEDPLAAVPVLLPPSQSYSAVNITGSQSMTLNPGTYVGGITVSGNASVTLNPGIYYLQGGGFNLSGNATVTGNGVMIYNASANQTHQIKLSGNANLTVSSMSTGIFAGISIYQSRASTADISISGNGTLNVNGVLYAPTAGLLISGNGNVNRQCLSASRFILKSLHFKGNGQFNVQ